MLQARRSSSANMQLTCIFFSLAFAGRGMRYVVTSYIQLLAMHCTSSLLSRRGHSRSRIFQSIPNTSPISSAQARQGEGSGRCIIRRGKKRTCHRFFVLHDDGDNCPGLDARPSSSNSKQGLKQDNAQIDGRWADDR